MGRSRLPRAIFLLVLLVRLTDCNEDEVLAAMTVQLRTFTSVCDGQFFGCRRRACSRRMIPGRILKSARRPSERWCPRIPTGVTIGPALSSDGDGLSS